MTFVDTIKTAWTTRTARARTMRELDNYHTRAEIEDLLAAADRSDSPEAEWLRGVLNAKLQGMALRRNHSYAA